MKTKYFVRAHRSSGMAYVHSSKGKLFTSKDRADATLFASKKAAQALAVKLNRSADMSANVETVFWDTHKPNPGPTKGARMNRLWKLAEAADAAFMRAVKKQFPKERAGDARYKSNRFNVATRKAAERMQRVTDKYLSMLRRK